MEWVQKGKRERAKKLRKRINNHPNHNRNRNLRPSLIADD